MHPSLERLFTKIETQRIRMLDSVRHLTPEQLTQPGPDGKWSVAEILSHLIAAERMSVQYMLKKFQGIDSAQDSGLREEFKINLLKISQRLPGLKFKAPAKVVEITVLYKNIDTITREWDSVRSEFSTLLKKIPAHQVNRMIYRHVRVGYLSVKHALIFYHEHVLHHTPQIKTLIQEMDGVEKVSK